MNDTYEKDPFAQKKSSQKENSLKLIPFKN